MPLQLSRLLRPFEYFFRSQASGGIILLAAAILALALANSPLREAYHHLWELQLTVGFRGFGISESLHFWINDGLMAVFFFVVGLEIRREFLAGELATPRQALLPIIAAAGGMVVPALIYVLFNPTPPAAHGWGIPMATDIAFALGVIALLGNRIPRSLAIFLTALAIVDDLGAVLVIALFYTGDLSVVHLTLAGGFLLVLAAGNRLGVQSPNYYALVGFCLWAALLKSGIHASIAGVLIGATIPVHSRLGHLEFLGRAENLLQRYRKIEAIKGPFLHEDRLAALFALEKVSSGAMSPLQRMEHVMNAWVIYGVMPIFALANAGISLGEGLPALDTVTLGAALGLLLGKPLGIFLFSWVAARLGICRLPAGVSWRQVLGVGILGGIGFTMSIFITNLAFSDPSLIVGAKIGIFLASLLAGIFGYLLLARAGLRGKRPA